MNIFFIIGAGPAGLAAAKALKQYPNLSATIFEAKSILGGLWALSEDRTSDSKSMGANCPPQLRTNLSRFTCSFSDLPWRTSRLFPKSYEVQQYLQHYASLSKDIFRFNTKVARVEHKSRPDQSPWKVSFLQDGGEETSKDFDFVIVASGFFAQPWIPQSLLPFSSNDPKVAMQTPRILHSSEYAFDRVLSLFPSANTAHVDRLPRKRKVVVVGGSLSAVEVISDLCININSIQSEASSAERTPGEMTRPTNMSNSWEVVHVVPRPFWVLPRFLPHLKRTPGDASSTPPPKFLPLDLIFYDACKLRNPPPSRSDTPPSEAERFHQSNTNFRTLLGYTSHAQADLSPNLEITEENGWMYCPPWITISDTYANFMREKRAEIVVGHVIGADMDIGNDSRITLTLTSNPHMETITEVDVVISCTGYKPSLDKFLSPEILRTMEYSTASPSSSSDVTFLPAILPQQMFLPCSTDLPHNATTTIGFVGMYKGPYFGVIELQARYLAALFAGELEWPKQEILSKDAEAMRSIRRSRENGKKGEDGSRERRQWSWGDYMGVVKGLVERLGIVEGTPYSTSDSSVSSLETEIDPIIPAHFPSQNTSQDALKSVHALKEVLNSSFLSISVFRALHGSWKVHRRIVSQLADVPGGVFEGTANFLPRSSSGDRPYSPNEGTGGYEYEYLYSEIGTFTLSNNSDIKLDAKRKYVYRYEEDREVVSVWFIKGDGWTTDGLFHEVTDFDGTAAPTTAGSQSASVRASGTRHLCGPDTYNTTYHFSFLNSGPELESLSIKYKVEGPKKNYISEATYERLTRL